MNNNMPPLVSIGMPVLNGGEYLRDALDSLLNQTYYNFELIFSDNGSSDDTAKIIREYAAKDKRIVPKFQKENIGAINNFQFVLKEAHGEYFMWAAHDDKWQQNYIEELVKIHEEYKDISLVFGQYIMMDENGLEFQKGRNSLFKNEALVVNYKHPKRLNAIIYYLDRNPFKFYGLFRTVDLKTIPQKLFLGSPQNSENLFLILFLIKFKCYEIFNTTYYYRVPFIPKQPKEISENPNFIVPSFWTIEKNFFVEVNKFFFLQKGSLKYIYILIMLLAFPLALAKPTIMKIYYKFRSRFYSCQKL